MRKRNAEEKCRSLTPKGARDDSEEKGKCRSLTSFGITAKKHWLGIADAELLGGSNLSLDLAAEFVGVADSVEGFEGAAGASHYDRAVAEDAAEA
jgi:hypothetical protein